MRLITSNVNGVRAAARKQGLAQLLGQRPDVITLQEVRSSSVQLVEVLAAEGFREWSVAHVPCRDEPGRSGVAVLSVRPLTAITIGLPQFEHDGRWIEAEIDIGPQPLIVVSAYVPKGHAGAPVQDHKMQFLAAASRRMRQLADSGTEVIVTGDLNIARTEADLKNWRQRIGKSGFLPEERDVLDSWEGDGWVDLGRALSGPGPGPYTWWSQRGRAFDNDAGWRIDYVWATPRVAQRATAARVLRASSWDARWSDHAAVLVEFARGEGLPGST